MKKTYKNPETRIAKIQVQQMIATSIVFGSSVNSANYAESRRGNAFFDDEDEE